jgi:uncharacterized membrane protein
MKQGTNDSSVLKIMLSAVVTGMIGIHAMKDCPGTFCTPNRPVAWVIREASGRVSDEDAEAIAATFVIGGSRVFDQDPRFGLLVLSEIASLALSPAVNDPGTAIDVTNTLVRLFVMWNECGKAGDVSTV